MNKRLYIRQCWQNIVHEWNAGFWYQRDPDMCFYTENQYVRDHIIPHLTLVPSFIFFLFFPMLIFFLFPTRHPFTFMIFRVVVTQLHLIQVTCMGIGDIWFTGAWTTYQLLLQERKDLSNSYEVILHPWKILVRPIFVGFIKLITAGVSSQVHSTVFLVFSLYIYSYSMSCMGLFLVLLI